MLLNEIKIYIYIIKTIFIFKENIFIFWVYKTKQNSIRMMFLNNDCDTTTQDESYSRKKDMNKREKPQNRKMCTIMNISIDLEFFSLVVIQNVSICT